MNGKSDEWRQAAHKAIEQLAHDNSMIVSDMVVAALEQASLGLDNYSALGGVFTRAAKAGLIVKTDIKQQSTRERSNSAKTVWRSLVYRPTGMSKEQNALSNLIIAALDFNAVTVRLASIVYAGGKLDKHAYKRVLRDFNAMSDTYQARQSSILETIGRER